MKEHKSKYDDFIKKAHATKNAKKKTVKQALTEYSDYRNGKFDNETGLPRPPARMRSKVIKILKNDFLET